MFNESGHGAADYLLIEKNSMLTIRGSVCVCVLLGSDVCLRGGNSQGDTSHISENSGCRQQSSSSLPAATDGVDLTLHLALTIFSTQHWGGV